MKTSIALIGFMGVGKTAVGKVLAEKLNKKLVELDALIEQKAGKSIALIFQQDGEIAFRELEIEVVKQVAQNKNLVIACGGGIVLNKINIDRLKKESVIVYLTASPKTVLKRILDDGEERPLLEGANKALKIRKLLSFRKPFYELVADIMVDTSNLDVDLVTGQIIMKLKEDESFNF